MSLVFFDDHSWQKLQPLTLTKPVCHLRCGIDTLKEKWEQLMACATAGYITTKYLQEQFTAPPSGTYLLINGSVIPDENLCAQIHKLPKESVLMHGEIILAAHAQIGKHPREQDLFTMLHQLKKVKFTHAFLKLNHLWDIFGLNGKILESDFIRITRGRVSAQLPASNKILGNGNFFAEEDAQAEACIFNTKSGSIYLGKHTEVMEGTVIRGAFALCEGAQVKLSSKIYGPTTIGPQCRVGGEVNNSVMQAYSNKGHDGFLGNSVIGEWCNLGADTNNSNLKNNYGEVDIYDYAEKKYKGSGLQFCGLFMGDHSKCGINTMFNTGTVVGVSANIFGAGFPPKFIPSFSWGGFDRNIAFRIDKAVELTLRVMERRDYAPAKEELAVLKHLYQNRENE
jgi:UDP-N-acetylglucosamine diphosphorylase/glucosamine-1-phosphate N-acetyltransferase